MADPDSNATAFLNSRARVSALKLRIQAPARLAQRLKREYLRVRIQVADAQCELAAVGADIDDCVELQSGQDPVVFRR